ncbi:hypothetical protein Asi02nite_52670 [Asanoa siamensis]|uniref:Uncharacterized protein n=1 Tax=Asanoa siamensis TaxID=926357 RepID=A0ABQ4CWU1_9ACTN|nr:hypothetical protein Asi02nite_52670 [Asanoa siamensis]
MGSAWVRELLTDAERVARGLTDPYYATFALSWLCEPWALANEPERALELARESLVSSRDVPSSLLPRVLMDVVDAFVAAGAHAQAEDIARGIAVAYARAWALASVAKAAYADDVGRAHSLAEEAQQLARAVTKPAERSIALASITDLLVTIGELDRAEEMAFAIPRADWQAGALAGLSQSRAMDGGQDRAEKLARRISDPDQLASALVGIARSTDDRQALGLLAEALILGPWQTALPELARRWPETVEVIAHVVSGRQRSSG